MLKDYQDQNTWAQKTWKNICASGLFSADRTIGEYAKEIWRIQAVDLSDDKT
jgi:starch phosphorylase